MLHASDQNGLHNGGIAEYWTGTAWTAFTPHTNTTIVAGEWFCQSGYIEWYDDDVSWQEHPTPNQQVRFRADTVGWLEFEIADITLRTTTRQARRLPRL